jgi:membrane associated rhomboid family serine protease
MFQRMIDDFKVSTGVALRQTTLAAFAAIALFITTSFLCAALFIVVFDKYGPVAACLAGAALFFVVTLIAALSYLLRKRQIERRAAERAKAATHSLLADPMMVATGIQLARTIGVKRLIPLLAVGGLALGLLAGRSQSGDQAPAE